jgi:hypothetical protein
MNRRDGTERPRTWAGIAPLGILLTIALAFVAPASANPVPDAEAREMNDRPGRWLAHPTPEDEVGLVRQFGAYGVSRHLLSPATMKLLEASFDRFAPLLVAAQRPPRVTHQNLQRWFRERADRAQAEAMMEALRAWLTATVTEAPIRGGMRIDGPPEMVARDILDARLGAAEALGDWGDVGALPELRAMLERLPEREPILVAAIRRITDPEHADVLVVEKDGRVTMRRPRPELISMTITSHDAVTDKASTWVADRAGIARIWPAFAKGRERRQTDPYEESADESVAPRLVKMYFRDGRIVSLERSGGPWIYEDNGRLRSSFDVSNPALTTSIMQELHRVGIAPPAPRFVGESVTLRIERGRLQVIGVYDFEGAPRDGWLPLRYPIAQAEGLGRARIESVALRSEADMKPLPVACEPHGSDYRIGLTPGKVAAYELEVRYSQPLTGRSAKYLITTAREWGRPLHRGWFQVIVDSTLGEPRFDLPFTEVAEGRGRRRFLYEAAPFRPERDLVVSW